MPPQLHPPTKHEMALLPPFEGLTLDRIVVVSNREEIDSAYAELSAATYIGFDTESRPTFVKGEVSDGPHVVQFATNDKAFIFQLHRTECRAAVASILALPGTTKVGFGLSSDRRHLARKLGAFPKVVLDLDTVFRRRGYRKAVGVRAAVAIVFNRRFQKSKRVTTSDWATERLRTDQILYAANDAYAAIQVFNALGLTEEQPRNKPQA